MKLLNFFFKIFNNNKRFFLYYLIGNFVAIIDLILLFVLTDLLHIFYLISASISFVIASLIHFLLNKKYTFQNKSKKYILQYFLVIISGLITLLLNLLLLFVFVEFIGLWYIYARIISAFLLLFFTYNFNKYVTYGVLK